MENMNEKIKTICLILITVAILAGAVFYCYDKYMRLKMDGVYSTEKRFEIKYGK